jgi:Ca2+-binding RTX toxin-like protein
MTILAITPASAFADALVDLQGLGTLKYEGTPGAETTTVTAAGGDVTITSTTTIQVHLEDQDPGECTGDNTATVTCSSDEVEIDALFMTGSHTGGGNTGNDVFTVDTSVPPTFDVEIFGGAGNDTLTGGLARDVIEGDAGEDTVNGGANGDRLTGGSFSIADDTAADTLSGGIGDDQLRNSGGADTYSGGDDTDTVNYSFTGGSTGIDADIGTGSTDDGPGCPGAGCDGDTIQDDVEDLVGDDGDDTLGGSSTTASVNVLTGAGGNDTLRGGSGTGPDGADDFNGNSGTDTVTYALRTDDIDADIGGGNNDGGDVVPANATAGCPAGADCEDDDIGLDVERITGGTGDDDLIGSNDADVAGNASFTSANLLNGGAGDDELDGGASAGADAGDVFIGGSNGTSGGQNGNNGDTVTYATRTVSVTAAIGNGADDGSGGCPTRVGCEDDDVRFDIENLTGGAGRDTLIGDSDANRLQGGAGDDTMRGGRVAGADGADSFDGGAQGTAGDTVSYENRSDGVTAIIGFSVITEDAISTNIDNLVGSSGPDSLAGDADANSLDGRGSDDLLNGDFGNTGPDAADTFIGGTNGTAGDTVSYAPRQDDVTATIGGAGGAEGDTIDDGVENLTGGEGGDALTGSATANTLTGREGNDTLTGAEGADTFDEADAANGADDFVGGPDVDTVSYRARSVAISATINDVANDGEAGEADNVRTTVENLSGGSAGDSLRTSGSTAANTLFGRGGVDSLNAVDGIAGNDTVNGGPQADTCRADADDARTSCP